MLLLDTLLGTAVWGLLSVVVWCLSHSNCEPFNVQARLSSELLERRVGSDLTGDPHWCPSTSRIKLGAGLSLVTQDLEKCLVGRTCSKTYLLTDSLTE